MEKVYLEYQVSDGYVIKISKAIPTAENIIEGHKVVVATNTNLKVGDEFDNYITVQEVDTEGNLTSSCMIKQPDSVKFLRQERDALKLQVDALNIALANMMGV